MSGWQPLAGAGLGLIAGSFLATLAVRWPRRRSIVRGRSACDACGTPLAWWRLLPLASYALQAGRCADCRAPIDPRHPLMEFACGALGALALALQPGWAGWAGALFGWLLATLALLDRDHLWLPDRLVLPLGALGLACGLLGLPPPIADRLLGALLGWGLLAAIAWGYERMRGRVGLGGGDPKLFGAIGAWLGWVALPWVLLGAAALGLLAVLAMTVAGRRVTATDRVPLGTLLAIAAWSIWAFRAAGG